MKAIYREKDNSMWPEKGYPIPCSRPHQWQDGKEYVEGRDYVVIKEDDLYRDAVFPLSPLPSNEDELLVEWLYKKCQDWGLYYNDAFGDHDYEETRKSVIEVVKELTKHFHITRK